MAPASRDRTALSLDAEFRAIVRDFAPSLYQQAYRMLGNQEDATEAVQEIFLNVHRSLAGFRGDCALTTWIYRIATNAALDWLRSVRGENISIDDIECVEVPHARDSSLESALVRKEMRECIRETVMELPAPYRVAIVLSEFEELSNAEIADVLGISVETVKIRLHRGRASLRYALNAKCTLYRDERNELACDRKVIIIKSPR